MELSNAKFSTVTLQKFKGNKSTHLTPLFCVIYAIIKFESRNILVKTARCQLDFDTSSTSRLRNVRRIARSSLR